MSAMLTFRQARPEPNGPIFGISRHSGDDRSPLEVDDHIRVSATRLKRAIPASGKNLLFRRVCERILGKLFLKNSISQGCFSAADIAPDSNAQKSDV
jgi:hypothetical protein